MRGVLLCLFFCACLAGVLTQNPGLQAKVTDAGLKWGTNIAFDLLTPMVIGKQLPPIRGSARIIVGDVHYDINRARVLSFNKGNFQVIAGNGDVRASAQSFSARLSGHWSYRYKIAFITIGDSGSFDASVNVNFNVGVGVSADGNGRPYLRSTACNFHVNNLNLRFSGGASWLYNLFIDFVANMFKGQIGGMVCDGMGGVINSFVNPAIAKMPLEFTIPDLGVLDFHMTRSPLMVPNSVQSYHRGVFYPIGDRTYPPFTPEPFPTGITDQRMVTLWVSAFVANSFLYAMRDKLEADITPEMLGPTYAEHLKINCDAADLCFGSILPEATKANFTEDAIGFIKVRASERPHVEIAPGVASVNADIHMEAYVRDEGEVFFLFSADVNANGGAGVSMANNKIHFEVKTINVHLSLLENEAEGLRESTLNILIRAGLATMVKPMLNDMGKAGLPLPTIRGINYRNPTISLHQGAVVFMVDGSH